MTAVKAQNVPRESAPHPSNITSCSRELPFSIAALQTTAVTAAMTNPATRPAHQATIATGIR